MLLLKSELKRLKTRRDIWKVLQLNNTKKICEIGVREGDNFKCLSQTKPSLLIGVDIWGLNLKGNPVELKKFKDDFFCKNYGDKFVDHYFKWQQSFYDHVIRQEKDFLNHLNYIALNCIKHKTKE